MGGTDPHRRGSRGEMQGRTLAAELAAIRRMIGVSAHTGDRTAVVLDDDAAADAAVAARGTRLVQCWRWELRYVVATRNGCAVSRGRELAAAARIHVHFCEPMRRSAQRGA